MCKALEYDNSILTYVITKLASYVCEWKKLAWLHKFIKKYKYDWYEYEASVYSEWYDTVNNEEIDNMYFKKNDMWYF